MPEVRVTLREVYGREVYYPANEAAHRFASVAGTKTLAPSVLAHAHHLGYAVRETYGRPVAGLPEIVEGAR